MIQKGPDGKETTVFVKLSESEIKNVAKETDKTELSKAQQLKDTVIIEVSGKSYVVTKAEFTTLTDGNETFTAEQVHKDMEKNPTRLAKQTQSATWQDRYGRRWYGSYSVGGSLVDELASRQVIKTGRFGLRQWVETKTYKTGHKTAAKARSTTNMAAKLAQLQQSQK